MKAIAMTIAIFALLIVTPVASAGERAKAEIDCNPATEKLVYNCKLKLMNRKTRAPIPGARIMIKADMPSMPMVHNVEPVNAVAVGATGNYTAQITLQMHGEWTLTLDISGPLRDRLVIMLNFDE